MGCPKRKPASARFDGIGPDRPSQVRNSLAAGGRRIRTSGPALARGSVGVIEGRCRTDRPAWRSLSSGALARRRWSGAGALPTAVPLTAGPKVRIQLPPAESQQRTVLALGFDGATSSYV